MLENTYQVIMAFVEVCTLLIWFVFAQLFFLSIRRQRRARFLIHTEGYDCSSMKVVLTNMAAEPVYVRNIFLVLKAIRIRKSITLMIYMERRFLRKK